MQEDLSKISMMDVETLVTGFLREKQTGIVNLHRIYFKNNNNQVSYRALIEEMLDELKTGCVSFVNKNSSLEGLDSYLFYIVNSFCKSKSVPLVKKKIEYVCPGCLFLGKQNLIYYQRHFICDSCEDEYKNATDVKWKNFFEIFKKHNKKGIRCNDCNRFIPDPLLKTTTISCPYLDCCFVGDFDSLKKMNHPSSSTNPERLVLDLKKENGKSLGDIVSSDEPDPYSVLDAKQELNNKVKVISDVIENQVNTIHWNSSDFTVKHKVFVYQAFKKLLDRYPEEIVSYLLDGSRSGGFQHKAFQEYISILESNFPLPFKKGKTISRIESLLDDNLSLFDGISVFDAIVNENQQIKNGTKEFYIGGRKASYTEPYYIGKLLNIINSETKDPILHHVKEYSFSKIKLNNVAPGTPVTVTHLRIPPHYQMGGMVYVNRIRKKIVDKSLLILKKEKDE